MNNYILSTSLQRAVEVALYLDKPLLLCGEPGTGKTTLAKYLASVYSKEPPGDYAPFSNDTLIFNTKTTSVATDLFYSYDALNRLRDAYAKVDKSPGDYIELKALGKAIVFKHGAASPGLDGIRSIRDFMVPDKIPPNAASSVVLIDEIDKAPRDFPNDILNEIEKQEFEIKELNTAVPAINNKGKVFVIMTSNNEKNLPDAFLRRCVFHYIEFPDGKQLNKIIGTHFQSLKMNDDSQVMGVIKTFNELRNLPLWKKPATAEFIDWLRILERENLLNEAQHTYETMPDTIRKQLLNSLGLLFKNNNDISQVEEALKNL
jgi:MoxR-like ATPase